MFNKISLQKKSIDNLIHKKSYVNVYLKNGYRFQGFILISTENSILLHTGLTEIILKNNIRQITLENSPII